jgi:hypothetical protein
MTTLESVSHLHDRTKTITKALREAALEAATRWGYDRTDEKLLR